MASCKVIHWADSKGLDCYREFIHVRLLERNLHDRVWLLLPGYCLVSVSEANLVSCLHCSQNQSGCLQRRLQRLTTMSQYSNSYGRAVALAVQLLSTRSLLLRSSDQAQILGRKPPVGRCLGSSSFSSDRYA